MYHIFFSWGCIANVTNLLVCLKTWTLTLLFVTLVELFCGIQFGNCQRSNVEFSESYASDVRPVPHLPIEPRPQAPTKRTSLCALP